MMSKPLTAPQATPMTDEEIEDIRNAWQSFTTLGTARWWDLGLRLLATIDALRQENTGLKRTGAGVSGLLIDSTLTADIRIKALEWLVRTMRGELKLSGKHDSNCGGHDGRPCDCPYGRVLDLTESDYPRCPQ